MFHEKTQVPAQFSVELVTIFLVQLHLMDITRNQQILFFFVGRAITRKFHFNDDENSNSSKNMSE